MRMIRVMIVDDHEDFRNSLKAALAFHSTITVAGEAASGEEAIEQVATLKPDVVLMDVSMSGMSGVDATREIVRRRPDTRIIGLSMHDDPLYEKVIMEAGARGVVAKGGPVEQLTEAIESVHRGATYLRRSNQHGE